MYLFFNVVHGKGLVFWRDHPFFFLIIISVYNGDYPSGKLLDRYIDTYDFYEIINWIVLLIK